MNQALLQNEFSQWALRLALQSDCLLGPEQDTSIIRNCGEPMTGIINPIWITDVGFVSDCCHNWIDARVLFYAPRTFNMGNTMRQKKPSCGYSNVTSPPKVE